MVTTTNRRRDAGIWLSYVQRKTELLVGIHTRLAARYPELVRALEIDGLVGRAQTAMADLDSALMDRIRHFPVHRLAARDGLEWQTLRNRFIGSSVRVARVNVALCSAVSRLLEDVEQLPTDGPVHLTAADRRDLEGVEVRLTRYTGRSLEQAQVFFTEGTLSIASAASTS